MLCIELRFLAGRYHATPWGRHVNEGEVAWPPEPWRLIRALLAVWHRKLHGYHRNRDSERLTSLIARLAEVPPIYELPPATRAHTRHFMPGDAQNTTLVLDAFARVLPEKPLKVIWPELELPESELGLLDELLAGLGYLGRAESWVSARRTDGTTVPNCWPIQDNQNRTLDVDGDPNLEVVEMLAATPADIYAERRAMLVTKIKSSFRGKKLREAMEALPKRYIDALQIETRSVQRMSWNLPPAARWIQYARPLDAFRVERRWLAAPSGRSARAALFLLVGKRRPRVEHTLRIAELVRWATLRAATEAGSAPPLLSGHSLPAGGPPHQHAFFLPLDTNGDGFIDRVLVHVPGGLDSVAQGALGKLRRLYDRDGSDWRLVLEEFDPAAETLRWTMQAKHWCSTTPYLHPWHRKKRFAAPDQIRRECRHRGLPEPENIERLATISVGGRTRRPAHFVRCRRKRSLVQPDRQGSFWRLSFRKPVAGPLALGFGCHFGLGLFHPEEERR